MPSSLPSLTMSLLLPDVMTTPWPFYGTHGKFSQAKSFCEEVNRTRHLVLKNTMKHLITVKDLTGNMDFLEISVEQDNSNVYSEF